ncbi:maleylpyruvate isomerase N-terminal domain-containing protein [Agrococcus sp. SGAir0287]|uniref:maleylpyruvate isomerase N-terminal domain-containing protein n=1 Tax=Agrococcus sp. SGAir0287 TaxID=2070347 RepID=UPI001586C49E|nr:maleylpyruvate isomerase N-terminal domain-containing protein [Agrococcus sp. SGAir0287]
MALPLRELYLDALELCTAEALAASDSLGLPSACEGWTIADVVLHLVATQRGNVIAPIAEGAAPVGPSSDRADLPAVRAIGAWERTAREAMAVVDACDDEQLPLLYFPTMDLTMHAWDIRWGIARIGLADRLELPEPLLAFAEGLPSRIDGAAVRTPSIFAPAHPVPPGASRTAAIMAWAGRRV